MKERIIRISRKARSQLDQIAKYTEETWGAVQCERYLATLMNAIDSIAETPHLGRSRNEVRRGTWSWRVESHVIYYDYDDTKVEIIGILHGRMDPLRHLPPG